MLLRRVPAEFFIMGMQRLSDEQVGSATPELLADYLEFFSIRSIMRKDSPRIADEVLSGEISLSDVREVGIDHLKIQNRLEIARPALKELQRGTDKFTVKDLASLFQKEYISPAELKLQRDYMIRYGSGSLSGLSVLGVDSRFSGTSLVILATNLYPEAKEPRPEALSVIDYTARLIQASGITKKIISSNSFGEATKVGKLLYEAGVDVQYAAERINDEDPQVIAATFHGTHKAVSSGWL